MSETIIKIEGMSCDHCTAAVEAALKAVPGVQSVAVDLAKKQAAVSGNASLTAMHEAIEDIGFEVVE